MKNALLKVVDDCKNIFFEKTLMEALIDSGHGQLMAEHVLLAYLGETGSEFHKHLANASKKPEMLAKIVQRQIPEVTMPSVPPDSVNLEAFAPELVTLAADREVTDLGDVLTEAISPTLKKILSTGNVLTAIKEAFHASNTGSHVDAKLDGPCFFTSEGHINREIFTQNALRLLTSVERMATEFGYKKITIPICFAGYIQEGILGDYCKGFCLGYTGIIQQLKINLAKTALQKAIVFSRETISPPVARYIQRLEQTAALQGYEVFDEPLLVTSFCRLKSDITKGYWRSFGLDPLAVEKMIRMKKDISSVNHETEPPGATIEDIHQKLEERLIGQPEAIQQTLPVIRRWLMKFYLKDRPTDTLLFMGPPGVGKTELSRELAVILYGNRKKLCFIEMNQMTEKHTVSRLIGSPPGYQGSSSGMLTDWIVENPESIILFDEIEKAHPNCFDILLRLLNEGKIQDAKGKEYDATKCLILLTSNIGQTEGFFDYLMHNPEVRARVYENPLKSDRVRTLLRQHFRPEFISRLNGVIIFNSLLQHHFKEIGRLAAKKLMENYRGDFGIEDIDIGSDVFDVLAEEANLQDQGARGIISKVNGVLNDTILEYISLHPGIKRLSIRWEGDDFEIS